MNNSEGLLDDNSEYDNLITDETTFPRCEYKARFKGTTVFQMSDEEHWGTYFRDFNLTPHPDRIAKRTNFGNFAVCENLNINLPSEDACKSFNLGTTGANLSPWSHAQYRKIFLTGTQKQTHKYEDSLYDQLLTYKLRICKKVVRKFDKISKLEVEGNKMTVYVNNDYPCVMVQIEKFLELLPKLEEQNYLYKIVVAYFIAITNKVAATKRVPVELVYRSGFGFSIPAIAATRESFRISIGLVPTVYAEVLAMALVILNNNFIIPLLNRDKCFKFDKDTNEVGICNEVLTTVDLIDFLCLTRDSAGQQICYRLTEGGLYTDLLADLASKELEKELEAQNLARPLMNRISNYYRKNDELSVQNNGRHFQQRAFCEEEHEDIANDQEFWAILDSIASVFDRRGIDTLLYFVSRRRLLGLYRVLEKSNLEFVSNSGSQNSEDGYGSDSDCEVETRKGITLHSKKLILSSGMRAVTLAQYLCKYLTRDNQYMYFESAMSLPLVKDGPKLLNVEFGENEQNEANMHHKMPSPRLQGVLKSPGLKQSQKEEEVRFIDLVWCASQGSSFHLPTLRARPNEKVIVFDYTSATCQRIGEAVKLAQQVPIVLLVGSGMKHEQIGADMNPYGTIRIIAHRRQQLEDLYNVLTVSLGTKEVLPKELHAIRRAYKAAGAAVTSSRIFTMENGFKYLRRANDKKLGGCDGNNN